jgi:hypothetical protein
MNTTSKKENRAYRLKQGSGDVAHTIARVGLSMIPVVGGAGKEIFAAIVTPPLVKRRDEWIESIAEGLKKQEEKIKGFELDNLSKNEAFITTVTYATMIAIRNHEKEKIAALRNAVLNAALPSAPEGDLQPLYLSIVDFLTPWHMKILKFLDNPWEWIEKYKMPVGEKWKQDWEEYSGKRAEWERKNMAWIASGSWWDGRPEPPPEFKSPYGFVTVLDVIVMYILPSDRTFFLQICRDLSSRGLVNSDLSILDIQCSPFHLRDSFRGLPSQTTDLGKQIIKFISPPIEEHDN